ncbi:MAG: hypothetical protein V4819_07925 [Verrucomicrobiota bacterium]
MKYIPTIPSALAVLTLATLPLTAGTPVEPAPMEPAAPKLKLNVLLQLDVSDHYITPRGLDVTNEGVVLQPLFLLFANLYSSESTFLTDVTLTAGVWSSFQSEAAGVDPSHWNEFDPILGLAFKFAEYFKFETNYTAFKSMTDSYPMSHHMELKLSFDDSKWLGKFALNPHIAYWQELKNKATVVFDPSTSEESFYFTLGINPTIKFDAVKLEFPTFLNIVGDEFYQQFDGSAGGGGAAVFFTSIKASVPLKFIPQEYGFWTWYAGVKYYHLNNDGLEDGNMVLTTGGDHDDDDLVQFHTGLTIFF